VHRLADLHTEGDQFLCDRIGHSMDLVD
jgi:hypothetical protein